MRQPHAPIVRGLVESLDLAGTTEPFDARKAEVTGHAMLTRKGDDCRHRTQQGRDAAWHAAFACLRRPAGRRGRMALDGGASTALSETERPPSCKPGSTETPADQPG